MPSDERNNLVDSGDVLTCRSESFFAGVHASGLIILLRFEDKLEKGNDGYGKKEDDDNGADRSQAQVHED